METLALKRSVLKAARTRLENTAHELRERIAELKSVTIGDDNAESASQTESTRGSDVELMNSLGEQLAIVQHDLDRMADIDPSTALSSVQYGSLVLTDQRNFLVGVSLEEFDAGGMSFLGVTLKAPLMQAMLGRKEGEKVSFNGTSYTIQQIC